MKIRYPDAMQMALIVSTLQALRAPRRTAAMENRSLWWYHKKYSATGFLAGIPLLSCGAASKTLYLLPGVSSV